MTPLQMKEIEDIVASSKAFAGRILAGKVDFEALRGDPVSVAAAHGVSIHHTRHEDFGQLISNFISKHEITKTEDLATLGSSGGCAACELGLGIAFSALIILTVVAVVAAIIAFAPEVAGPVALAFLESSAAVDIFLGIVLTAGTVLAGIVCVKLIKC